MGDIKERLAALSPQQRELLERELRRKGLGSPRPEGADAHAATRAGVGGPGASATAGDGSRAGVYDGREVKFSLFFFSDDGGREGGDKYHLLLESARFADRHGFCAVWTPERHSQDFGGLYPNPSVLGAALAVLTERVGIRAGSVALPLHHPLRVAEEWAVVDNLSRGRVGVSFASGWHPMDFALAPENFEARREVMFSHIEVVRRLWAGEAVGFEGVGGETPMRALPRPMQKALPVWVTTAGNPQTWLDAGRIGANVLTAFVRESFAGLAEKIRMYREARAANGHDPRAGEVAVMLHTFVGESDAEVKEQVRGPLREYFRANLKQLGLRKDYLASRVGDDVAEDVASAAEGVVESDVESIVSFAFERYFDTRLLCGSAAKCARLVEGLATAGVDEIACLVDFGLEAEAVLEGLRHLDALRRLYSRGPAPVEEAAAAACAGSAATLAGGGLHV
jgi:natural product biosynthesis luciferase-like monooxygenase protein